MKNERRSLAGNARLLLLGGRQQDAIL